jgi:DNA-3-methyladenine glycosylase II
VQRGLARWCLALHSPSDPFSLSPKKVSQAATEEKEKGAKSKQTDAGDYDSDVEEEEYLPVTGDKSSHSNSGVVEDKKVDRLNELPPIFTPSITKTLREPAGVEIEPLPKTLSITELKSRISGKKKVK